MIKLLLDIGNTRMKWGLRHQDTWLALGACYLEDLSTLNLPHNADQIFGINVAGSMATTQCNDWAKQYLNKSIHWLQTQTEGYGVTNGYQNYRLLGVDRWAAMIGAYWRYQQALCVVNCGTAITIDIIDNHGQHRGGIISPGIQLLQQSLFEATAQIQPQALTAFISANDPVRLGHNTQEGVTMGSLYTGAGIIDKIMQQWQHLDPRCILTGGDASNLANYITIPQDYNPDLVLYGVHLMSVETP